MHAPFLVVGSWMMGSVGTVMRRPVGVGVMRGRRVVGRRRGVGGRLVVTVRRRGGGGVSGGRLNISYIIKSYSKQLQPVKHNFGYRENFFLPIPGSCSGRHSGNGEKLSSSQAESGLSFFLVRSIS